MFTHSFETPQLIAAALIAVLEVLALVALWRSRDRGRSVKALWSAIIVLLPAIGAVGFFVNQGLGLLTGRIERSARS